MVDLAVAVIDGLIDGPPWQLIASQLNAGLRGTVTLYQGDLRPAERSAFELAWVPDAFDTIPWQVRSQELGHRHPLARLYASQATTRPLTVSDVAGDREWRRNPCYQATYSELDGSTRHLALPLPAPAGVARSFVVCRSGPDFTDRDREFARRLQPLLVSVDRHVTAVQHPSGPAVTTGAGELGLTPRERVVLSLLAEGLTAAAAARRLAISPHTVNKHRENLYRKFGTTDRVSTVLRAQKLGLITNRSPAGSTPH